MTSGFKQFLAASSLLILGTANLFAQSGNDVRSMRYVDSTASYTAQRAAEERAEPPNDAAQRLQDGRRSKEAPLPDSSGSGGQPEGSANALSEAARKQGKLSPEERRALRRQIDEAGHDIYAPKR